MISCSSKVSLCGRVGEKRDGDEKGKRKKGRVTNVVSVSNGHEGLECLLDHGIGELRTGDGGGGAHHRHDLLALDLVVLRVVVHDERAHHALLQRAVLADAVKHQPLVQLCAHKKAK